MSGTTGQSRSNGFYRNGDLHLPTGAGSPPAQSLVDNLQEFNVDQELGGVSEQKKAG